MTDVINMKTINVSETLHRQLMQAKLNNKLSSIEEVIEKLNNGEIKYE